MLRLQSVATVLVTLALELPLAAQYPGGGYPYPGGSRYPTIPGIPVPGRNKGKTADKQPTQALSGILQQINDGAIMLVTKDTRTITAKLSAKTAFLNKGEVTTAANFSAGDHVRIDATQDEQGFYHAVTVELESKGTAADRAMIEGAAPPSVQKSDDEDERPVLRRKPAAGAAEPAPEKAETPRAAEEQPEPEPRRQSSTQVAQQEPDCLDPDDPGRPVVRRGKPVPRKPATTKKPCVEPAIEGTQEVASANIGQWKTVPSGAAEQRCRPVRKRTRGSPGRVRRFPPTRNRCRITSASNRLRGLRARR